MTALTKAQIRLRHALHGRLADPERGDVPGWVLITLMTAGLVAALWGIAEGQLKTLFTEALNSVTGPS